MLAGRPQAELSATKDAANNQPPGSTRGAICYRFDAPSPIVAEVQMTMKSSLELFGLPLVHIATGQVVDGRYQRGIGRGWIAVGDIAFGVLLAVGGLAVGGISIGGLAVGVLALAGASIGVFAVGGLAVGVAAVGGAAVAWWAAAGGLAIARDVALGGAATAAHANDATARALVTRDSFVRVSMGLLEHSRWLVLLALLPVVMAMRQRRQTEGNRAK